MKIGFLGDIHASIPAARFMLWSMNRLGIETVVQVGDFGVYSDQYGEEFAGRTNRLCDDLGITLYVVPGNHENWRIINEIHDGDRTEFRHYRKNILLIPRGARWEWDGVSFVALGGAPSVDRTSRLVWDRGRTTENMSWYAEEAITWEDVEYVSAGGYADVMICHDAPEGVAGVDRVIRGNPHGFDRSDLLYADEGRRMLTEAFKAVAPLKFLHGHYHTAVNEYIHRPGGEYDDLTHILGLNKEFDNFSMGVLDTETMSLDNIDHRKLLAEYRDILNGQPWKRKK